MENLKHFEFKAFGGGEKGRYDWDKLLDGVIHKLKEGDDYQCKANTILMMARNHAKKKGLKLRANKVDDGKAVVIQAYKEGEETPKGKKGGK